MVTIELGFRAWMKSGFHEDGLSSGLDVAKTYWLIYFNNSCRMTNLKIINGQTWHGRRGKVENDLSTHDYLLFDPDNLNEAPWLLSRREVGFME